MVQNTKFRNRGLTIVELVVSIVIVAILMGYAWEFYFSGREITRHNVSQSQMQTDARIFFDKLGREIPAVYRFITVDGESEDTKKFSYYCFQFTRTPVETILFDEATGRPVSPQYQKFDVLKVEYVWNKADQTLTRKQTPGYLYFLRNPVEFTEGPAAQYEGTPNAPYSKVVLKNLTEFEVKAYRQKMKPTFGENELPYTIHEIKGNAENNASEATFIVIRIHNKIDEKGSRRDEELDLVCKFYSRVRLAEAIYPGYFSSVDSRSEY